MFFPVKYPINSKKPDYVEVMISIIRSPDFPSPNGFFQERGLPIIIYAALTIDWGSTPAITFAPTSTVSGRSVESRIVTQGTLRMQCLFLHSTRIGQDHACIRFKLNKLQKKLSGLIIWKPFSFNPNDLIIFSVRG